MTPGGPVWRDAPPRSRRLAWLAILGPGTAEAQQITTAGDCSAVIQQVGGNVTVNCYLDAAAAPKFRVTYYRLGGIGQSFLINGKLSPEWERHLGGQQAIVDNPVYDELRRLTERFGTEIGGSDLSGTVAFVDGGEYYESFGAYARSVDPASRRCRPMAAKCPCSTAPPDGGPSRRASCSSPTSRRPTPCSTRPAGPMPMRSSGDFRAGPSPGSSPAGSCRRRRSGAI
jgi:hypothetical protein